MSGRHSMYFLGFVCGLILATITVVVFPFALKTMPAGRTTVAAHASAVAVSHTGPAALYPNAVWTPGSANPAVTEASIGETICNKNWKTGSVRDTQSSPTQKATTYVAYGIPKPKNNTGQNQTCELDHFVSLELGGADSLDNIWPECGPANVPLNQRYFKEKDAVENYLHAQVCSGAMTLAQARGQIMADWYAVFLQIKGTSHRAGAVLDMGDPSDN